MQHFTDHIYCEQSKPDPLSWTLLFKKHKTTVLLMLPPQESISNAKTALLKALQARGVTEINGDRVPEDESSIEFGVAVDRNDPEKGWTRLETGAPEATDPETTETDKAEKSSSAISLQAADLRNGQSIAFRFQKHGEETAKNDGEELNADSSIEDQGWDVIVPKFDDEEEVEQ